MTQKGQKNEPGILVKKVVANSFTINPMTLTQIEPDKFETIKFPKETEFTFGSDNYKIEFTDPEEIRMALYIRSVKVFKNQKLIKSNSTVSLVSRFVISIPFFVGSAKNFLFFDVISK